MGAKKKKSVVFVVEKHTKSMKSMAHQLRAQRMHSQYTRAGLSLLPERYRSRTTRPLRGVKTHPNSKATLVIEVDAFGPMRLIQRWWAALMRAVDVDVAAQQGYADQLFDLVADDLLRSELVEVLHQFHDNHHLDCVFVPTGDDDESRLFTRQFVTWLEPISKTALCVASDSMLSLTGHALRVSLNLVDFVRPTFFLVHCSHCPPLTTDEEVVVNTLKLRERVSGLSEAEVVQRLSKVHPEMAEAVRRDADKHPDEYVACAPTPATSPIDVRQQQLRLFWVRACTWAAHRTPQPPAHYHHRGSRYRRHHQHQHHSRPSRHFYHSHRTVDRDRHSDRDRYSDRDRDRYSDRHGDRHSTESLWRPLERGHGRQQYRQSSRERESPVEGRKRDEWSKGMESPRQDTAHVQLKPSAQPLHPCGFLWGQPSTHQHPYEGHAREPLESPFLVQSTSEKLHTSPWSWGTPSWGPQSWGPQSFGEPSLGVTT